MTVQGIDYSSIRLPSNAKLPGDARSRGGLEANPCRFPSGLQAVHSTQRAQDGLINESTLNPMLNPNVT